MRVFGLHSTLCFSMPSRNNPFLHSFALALDSETHKTNERFTINRSTTKAAARFSHSVHIQSNIMYHIKYN